MTAQLNTDLQEQVDTHAGQAILVEHPGTHKLYVIVDSDTHLRAMQALRVQEDLEAIQQGIDAAAQGRESTLEEADAHIRKELGFPART